MNNSAARKAKNYSDTMTACFTGYIVQAIVNNFAPLLFLTFQRQYGIPLSKITLLVTFNFAVQLLVDLVSAGIVDRIGYRICLVAADLFSVAGFIMLATLPEVLPDPFIGILIAVTVYAIGGGLMEVLISPVMESCPSENKEGAMSLLHSFYCWGHVGVVLISTVFFRLFGIEHWKWLAILWSLIPLWNACTFTQVPIAPVVPEGETGMRIGELVRNRLFWLLLILMICAGASEQAVSQWASTFAEKGLGVTKTAGDLAGPMMFAVLMGLSRLLYGKYGTRQNADRFILGSGVLCIIAYLGIVFSPSPVLSLLFCGVAGFSVGVFWPGVFSKGALYIPRGGTALFALMALGGDVGCSGGPTVVGLVSSVCGDNLKVGILAAIVFPVLIVIGAAILRRTKPVH